MGQYWTIVCMDQEVNWGFGGKLGEFFWSEDAMAVITWLTQRTFNPSSYCRGWSASKPPLDIAASLARTKSPLLKLPAEIIVMVFRCFEAYTLHDALCLCLAHDYLGQIGEPVCEEMIYRMVSDSKPHRMVCIGDSAQDDDFPPHFRSYISCDASQLISDPAGDVNSGDNSYYIRALGFQYAETASRKLISSIFELGHWLSGAGYITEHRRLMRLARDYGYMARVPSYPDLLLLNASKGEYVRADAVEDLNQRLHDGDSESAGARYHVSLGHALLSKICWSSDDSCAMDCDSKRLTRGPWAGDKLIVTSFDSWDPAADTEMAWRDVSNEVVDWLEELWRCTVTEEQYYE